MNFRKRRSQAALLGLTVLGQHCQAESRRSPSGPGTVTLHWWLRLAAPYALGLFP